jgi:hypothetical protein
MIPDRALQLLDKDGFISAYFEGVRAGQTCKAAFEAANNEYAMYFQKPKYADYRSFAGVRDYELKKIKIEVKRFLKK